MKSMQKYLRDILPQTGAIFLLLIFLSTSFIPVLHHHENSFHQFHKNKKEYRYTSEKQVSTFYAQCKICELIKHQSTDLDHHPSLIFSFIPCPLPITKAFLTTQATSSFILKCSNKGPPLLQA